MHRRLFLKRTAQYALAAQAGLALLPRQLLAASLAADTNAVLLPQTEGGKLLVWNWSKKKLSAIPTPFPYLHNAIAGREPGEVLIFEKSGKSVCRVRWREEKVVGHYSIPDKYSFFYGHGVLDVKRDRLYATESQHYPGG